MSDNLFRNGLLDEIVKTCATDRLEHFRNVAVSRTNMSIHELEMTQISYYSPGSKAQKDEQWP